MAVRWRRAGLRALSFDCSSKQIEICWLSHPFHQEGDDPYQAFVQHILVAVEFLPQALEGRLAHVLGTIEAAIVLAMRVDRRQARFDAADVAMGSVSGRQELGRITRKYRWQANLFTPRDLHSTGARLPHKEHAFLWAGYLVLEPGSGDAASAPPVG